MDAFPSKSDCGSNSKSKIIANPSKHQIKHRMCSSNPASPAHDVETALKIAYIKNANSDDVITIDNNDHKNCIVYQGKKWIVFDPPSNTLNPIELSDFMWKRKQYDKQTLQITCNRWAKFIHPFLSVYVVLEVFDPGGYTQKTHRSKHKTTKRIELATIDG